MLGTELALQAVVLIAIPINQGRVSPVFDVATRLLLVQTKGQAQLERRELALGVCPPHDTAQRLADLGVKLIICGAISRDCLLLLEVAGIRVEAHICGEVESIVGAYCCGTLRQAQFVMPGCCRHRRAGQQHSCECQQHRFRFRQRLASARRSSQEFLSS